MPRFDFENADSFSPNLGTYLPVGNHVCTINSAVGGKTKANNYPQIELEVGNDSGTRKDWLVYNSDFGVSKVVGLYAAADITIQNSDQNENGELSDEAIARLVGKQVGVVIRLEDSFKNPGTQEPRIRGYVPATQVGDIPVPAGAAATSDDRIPF